MRRSNTTYYLEVPEVANISYYCVVVRHRGGQSLHDVEVAVARRDEQRGGASRYS